MPDRMLRGSILSSESLASLSHPAERLFYRLMLLADDFGRYHAGPRYVRAAAMGLLNVTVPNVAAWMKELGRADVICLYEVDGREYLSFKNWPRHQRLRAKGSKFPPHTGCVCCHMPADDDKCGHPRTNAPGVGVGDGVEKKEDPPAPPPGQAPSAEGLLWKAAEGMIGKGAQSFLGKLASAHKKPALMRAIGVMVAEQPANPRGFLVEVLKNGAPNGKPESHTARPPVTDWEAVARRADASHRNE